MQYAQSSMVMHSHIRLCTVIPNHAQSSYTAKHKHTQSYTIIQVIHNHTSHIRSYTIIQVIYDHTQSCTVMHSHAQSYVIYVMSYYAVLHVYNAKQCYTIIIFNRQHLAKRLCKIVLSA